MVNKEITINVNANDRAQLNIDYAKEIVPGVTYSLADSRLGGAVYVFFPPIL